MKTQCYFNNFLPSYKCVIDNGDVNMRPPNLKLSIMYIFGLMHKKLEFFYFSSLKTNFTVDCCCWNEWEVSFAALWPPWCFGGKVYKTIKSLLNWNFTFSDAAGVVRKREGTGDGALIKTKLFPCASPVFIPEPALLDVRSVFSWPRDKGQEMPWQDTCNLCWFLTFQDVEGVRMRSVKTIVLICFFLSLSSPALKWW